MNWLEIIVIIGLLAWAASILACLILFPIKIFEAIKTKAKFKLSKGEIVVLIYIASVPLKVFVPPLKVALDYQKYGVIMFPTNIYEEDSERCFNGDGSSYSIRKISNWTKNRMLKKYRNFTVIPTQKLESQRWTKYKWQPYNETFKNQIDFSLSWSSDSMRTRFEKTNGHNLWIGSEVRYNGSNFIGDTYLYILDATTNELYELNANT